MIKFYSYFDKEKKIDLYTKILLKYQNGVTPVAKVGLGVKSEGELIISGTRGYIYVPSPWWKTEYFELRFEEFNKNRKYFYPFQGEGLRYEIVEFLDMINQNNQETYKLKISEIKIINEILNKYLRNRDNLYINSLKL